jgi:hypothetical protein
MTSQKQKSIVTRFMKHGYSTVLENAKNSVLNALFSIPVILFPPTIGCSAHPTVQGDHLHAALLRQPLVGRQADHVDPDQRPGQHESGHQLHVADLCDAGQPGPGTRGALFVFFNSSFSCLSYLILLDSSFPFLSSSSLTFYEVLSAPFCTFFSNLSSVFFPIHSSEPTPPPPPPAHARTLRC